MTLRLQFQHMPQCKGAILRNINKHPKTQGTNLESVALKLEEQSCHLLETERH